jgi:Zn-dependent peptidase ImmA (M78 family)
MMKRSERQIIEDEREANLFAYELLMPTRFVHEWINEHYPKRQAIDALDDAMIQHMAEDFQVTIQMATIRMCQLFNIQTL